jgi:hypothetical protein
MLVRNLFYTFTSIHSLETFFLTKTGILYFCASLASSQHDLDISAVPVMSLLRIFLEGDHG